MARVLHDILLEVVDSGYCYFQPPSDNGMNYPCIKYNYAGDFDQYADNKAYLTSKRYTVTIIDEDPDSKIPERLKELLYCSSDGHFVVDGLHHYVYTLYYNGPRIKEEKEDV